MLAAAWEVMPNNFLFELRCQRSCRNCWANTHYAASALCLWKLSIARENPARSSAWR